MSLIGQNVAFIPIGLSCQVANQLFENRQFLSILTGEALKYRSSFFNWILVDSLSVAGLVKRLMEGPLTEDSFHLPESRGCAVELKDHGVWLWHEKPSHEVGNEEFFNIVNKYEHLRKNFVELTKKDRRVFIIGAGQNDLNTSYPIMNGDMNIELSDHVLEELRNVLELMFPNGQNIFLAAARADRVKGEGIYTLSPEGSDWEGFVEDWQRFLTVPIFHAFGSNTLSQNDILRAEQSSLSVKTDELTVQVNRLSALIDDLNKSNLLR